MAMIVAASKGSAVDEQARMMATRLRMPRSILTNAESDTTMALSTSIPMAIMIAASDMRCKAMPEAIMTISVAKMENTSPLPIRIPFLNPIKNNRMATTVRKEIIKIRIKP